MKVKPNCYRRRRHSKRSKRLRMSSAGARDPVVVCKQVEQSPVSQHRAQPATRVLPLVERQAKSDGMRSMVFRQAATLLRQLRIDLSDLSEIQLPPLQYFAREQLLHSSELLIKRLVLRNVHIDLVDSVTENLITMHLRILQSCPAVGAWLAGQLHRFVTALSDVAEILEMNRPNPVNWRELADRMEEVANKFVYKSWDVKSFVPAMRTLRGDQLLGQGGFGCAYRGRHIPTNLELCIKVVPLQHFQLARHACSDKLVASVARCKFVVSYYAAFETRTAHIALMEFVKGSDLNKLTKASRVLGVEQVRMVAAQLYLGLEYLHMHGFVHRDVKSANVLVTMKGLVKLIDFDTSKVCLSHYVRDRALECFFARTAREFRDREKAGTLAYRAPEAIQKQGYGRALDWWALGCVVFKITTGRLPFHGDDAELKRRICETDPEWSSQRCSDVDSTCQEFINALMIKDPTKRLGSSCYSEIRQHAFFAGLDFDSLSKADKYETLCEMPKEIIQIHNMSPLEAKQKQPNQQKKFVVTLAQCEDVLKPHRPLMTYVSRGFARAIARYSTGLPDPPSAEPTPEYTLLRFNEKEHFDQVTDKSEYVSRSELRGQGPKDDSTEQTVDTITDTIDPSPNSRKPTQPPNVSELSRLSSKKYSKSDLKYTRQYNPSLEILELTMPRSGVCPQKFGFSYRLLSGVDGSVGFVYRVKPDSVASRAGLFYGDMIAKVVPKDNPRIREIIHSSSYVSLAVYAHNPFRLAQLHRDIAHVLKMDRNDAKDLRLMCFRDKCRLRAGFSLKTFISAADGGTYSAHIFHRVHPKLMKGEMDNRLYAGDLLLCVNGIPTTGMKSQKEVADIVKLHRRRELILSILPCSPLRVPN
ncbi:microtubule-associated serine/threonine-protein kinase 4-like isoform X2 [Varroa jacobsoni]|uniref:microtubule-associated serine/threonine-protein kinase 4-like isoform X2 n=1 Tax=Varroa jacobsoni TaxID=62625 RepID=UPI000BF6EC92|nr:microtubule-associated serine/threonine-protein kinase 4-like isoform X2 [Varroa jacobsoni]